jgi:hypothetical protein
MQSLTEGIKFVFNNKTVLGAITLTWSPYYLVVQWPYYLFFSGYFKGGSEDLVFKGSISHWFFNDAITAYVPLSKMPE